MRRLKICVLTVLIIWTLSIALQYIWALKALTNGSNMNTLFIAYEELAIIGAWIVFITASVAFSGRKKTVAAALMFVILFSIAMLPVSKAEPTPYPKYLGVLAVYDGDITFPLPLNLDTLDYYCAVGALITYFKDEFGVTMEFTAFIGTHSQEDRIGTSNFDGRYNRQTGTKQALSYMANGSRNAT